MGAKGSETSSRRTSGARLENSERNGMIQRLVGDVFRLMKESPATVEYTVRCSFVEIYLEKVLDLLNPTNRGVQVSSPEDSPDGSPGGDVELEGASEACCFDKTDVISLLMRGNASRTVSSTKMNSDSSRSHAVFVIKVEQRDAGTGITKASRITLVDLAGSELGAREIATDDAVDDEARMINKSLSVLARCVSTVAANQRGGSDRVITHEVPYRMSKLTHELRDAFGGNCRTSIVLTASPASYNIGESVRTMKFGHVARTVTNQVKPRVEMCPTDYRKLLQDGHARQAELVTLVNQLSAECFQLKQDSMQDKFQEKDYGGPLWETIENILVNGATPAARKHGAAAETAGTAKAREELAKVKEELRTCQSARDGLENALAERQSEVALLQAQNDTDAKEKKRYAREAVSMRNEIRLLTQRKQEVEHNLRTSQFREYEATVFLRQFRRFYRRLLRNKAAQGTGRTGDVIERVPGVPDLNDLIDVDTLLLEAGLIEESELRDDTATGAYRPSAQALERSGRASDMAASRAGEGGAPDVQTPAGKLTAMRERELERDLLKATERCIELQVALNEERANVEILTNRAGNVNKKKHAQESIQLKQQLEKKTHDLQAIIWKMNELHLINKTYNEKMSNREQHVTYLEENLVELQNTNRTMILERRDVEDALREELDSLKVLVDAMTVPLWQLGECGITGRALASRIRMPVSLGGSADDGNDETSHPDSMDESYVEEDESDDDEEMEEEDRSASDGAILGPPRPAVPTAEVSTQTAVAADEKSTMTDFAPETARAAGDGGRSRQAAPGDYSSFATGTTASVTENDHRGNSNGTGPPARVSYRGGALPGTQPRRFVPKYGLMIRPGVLKETRPKQ